MPNVELIRAAHQIIVSYGRASAKAWDVGQDRCDVLLPIPPGTVDTDALVEIVSGLEFVERVEPFSWLRGQPGVAAIIEPKDAVTLLLPGIRVVCRVNVEDRHATPA